MKWPFVLRRHYDGMFEAWSIQRTENFTLRDALRSANDEIRKLRSCIAELSKPK